MGSLNALGIRIEESRQLLEELKGLHFRNDEVMDKLGSEWSEDVVIRLAHIRKEMSFDYEGEKRSVALIDFMWAVDFLDHLDTLGLAVAAKEWIDGHKDAERKALLEMELRKQEKEVEEED